MQCSVCLCLVIGSGCCGALWRCCVHFLGLPRPRKKTRRHTTRNTTHSTQAKTLTMPKSKYTRLPSRAASRLPGGAGEQEREGGVGVRKPTPLGATSKRRADRTCKHKREKENRASHTTTTTTPLSLPLLPATTLHYYTTTTHSPGCGSAWK